MREKRKFCKKRGENFERRRKEIEEEAGKNEHRQSCGSSSEFTKISQKKVKVSLNFFIIL